MNYVVNVRKIFQQNCWGKKIHFPKIAKITFVNKQNGPFLSVNY